MDWLTDLPKRKEKSRRRNICYKLLAVRLSHFVSCVERLKERELPPTQLPHFQAINYCLCQVCVTNPGCESNFLTMAFFLFVHCKQIVSAVCLFVCLFASAVTLIHRDTRTLTHSRVGEMCACLEFAVVSINTRVKQSAPGKMCSTICLHNGLSRNIRS